MKARVFSISYDRATRSMDDSELRNFLCEHRLVSFSDHFCIVDETPTLFVSITYQEQPSGFQVPFAANDAGNPGKRPEKELAESDLSLYNALRLWRNNKAKAIGVSNFIIFSNRQLGQIASIRPTTLVGLGDIDGVGDARLRDHGNEIVDIVKSFAGLSKSPEMGVQEP